MDGYYDYNVKNHLLDEMVRQPQLPDNIRSIPGSEEIFGVIVIGESSSRKHYGIYGYQRQTTPKLDLIKNELSIFRDVISAYCTTATSLKYCFTFAALQNPAPRCSMVDILNATGYETFFISNQYRWGVHDGPTTMIFSHASERMFLTEKDKSSQDSALIPVLHNLIQKRTKKTMVFLHMIGSHRDYKRRYPNEFAYFNGFRDNLNRDKSSEYAELHNEYDNSIAFTDNVLEQTIASVKTLRIPAFMLFFSDHGETVEDDKNTFRTGKSKNPQNYEVPMLVWLSPEYKKRFPEFTAEMNKNVLLPFQMDNLIWSLSDIARIRFDNFEMGKNLFSASYKPAQRYMMGTDGDYDKIRKHKLLER